MEYRRFKEDIVVRMDRGEEILENLKKVSLKEGIKLANVNGIGAIDDFTIGVYDVEKREYHSREMKGAFEIVSLTGNINTMDGEYYSHLHLAAADKDSHVYGGHLNRAVVSATLELFIHVIDGCVDRIKDEETGLNIFEF